MLFMGHSSVSRWIKMFCVVQWSWVLCEIQWSFYSFTIMPPVVALYSNWIWMKVQVTQVFHWCCTWLRAGWCDSCRWRCVVASGEGTPDVEAERPSLHTDFDSADEMIFCIRTWWSCSPPFKSLKQLVWEQRCKRIFTDLQQWWTWWTHLLLQPASWWGWQMTSPSCWKQDLIVHPFPYCHVWQTWTLLQRHKKVSEISSRSMCLIVQQTINRRGR